MDLRTLLDEAMAEAKAGNKAEYTAVYQVASLLNLMDTTDQVTKSVNDLIAMVSSESTLAEMSGKVATENSLANANAKLGTANTLLTAVGTKLDTVNQNLSTLSSKADQIIGLLEDIKQNTLPIEPLEG